MIISRLPYCYPPYLRAYAFFFIISFFNLFLFFSPSFALHPWEILSDVQLEMRARHLSAQLRCPVCQNQSIDESDSDLALDLRTIVREKLQKGESDTAIKEFFVARYGDFILLQPPPSGNTFLLWGAPFLIFIFGSIFLLYKSFQGRKP